MEQDTAALTDMLNKTQETLSNVDAFAKNLWKQETDDVKRYNGDFDKFRDQRKEMLTRQISVIEITIKSIEARNSALPEMVSRLNDLLNIIRNECYSILSANKNLEERYKIYVEGAKLVSELIREVKSAENLHYEELYQAVAASEQLLHDLTHLEEGLKGHCPQKYVPSKGKESLEAFLKLYVHDMEIQE